tara:strand:+ start:226 stop:789 length:564 start_codon:yes stop_codon:yes gene_type:complete
MLVFIYKWSCIDSPDLFYVGSTWDMKDRKYLHKSDSKTSEYKTYVICRENGGYDNFVFEILEEYDCNDKIERLKREQYWIDTLNPSMNTFRAYITDEQKKEYSKEWYNKNRELLKEYWKEHYQQNKERYKEYYCLKNKEQNKEQSKENSKQYKQKNSETIECECGGKYKKYRKSTHIKSNLHKNFMS